MPKSKDELIQLLTKFLKKTEKKLTFSKNTNFKYPTLQKTTLLSDIILLLTEHLTEPVCEASSWIIFKTTLLSDIILFLTEHLTEPVYEASSWIIFNIKKNS